MSLILENSIKFTYLGSVIITVKSTKSKFKLAEDIIIVQISDTGIGGITKKMCDNGKDIDCISDDILLNNSYGNYFILNVNFYYFEF